MVTQLHFLSKLDDIVLCRGASTAGPVSLESRLANTPKNAGSSRGQHKKNHGKSAGKPQPMILNFAAERILQPGHIDLYKGGLLGRLKTAMKLAPNGGGLRNLLSVPPTDFSAIGDAPYFAKQKELALKFAEYARSRYQVLEVGI